VREAAELFLKGTDPRGTQVTIEAVCEEGLPHVRADAGRLIQVLLSLLGNAHEAILATRRHGCVTARAGITIDQDREWVTIDVCDDGPGIPDLYLDRIFEPFFTTKEAGSGYGLYLASEILREQNGRLTARNLPEGGACFTVWLPAVTSQALAETAAT
jgi:signal transduction histidine kinase